MTTTTQLRLTNDFMKLAPHGIYHQELSVRGISSLSYYALCSPSNVSRVLQVALTVDELSVGELSGLSDALSSGVTTVVDFFHASNSPEHCDAALAAAVQSGSRVVLCLARQAIPPPLTPAEPPQPPPTDDPDKEWQLAKLQEWAGLAEKNGWPVKGSLCEDGRVTVGMA